MKPNDILASRYQICEQLSKKAGRRTFLAQDLQSQELVIIKILRFDVDFQWDDLKLFEREADTLRNLDHSAIPRYLDYFEVEEPNTKGFALVQTYLDAPSLETALKDGRKFSEAEVMEIADRMLSILTYLHEQLPPIIHRDIKPSNILIANRSAHSVGDIYLIDFGSVQTLASKEGGTITIVGSYGYIPLEQFGGQTVAASDLYSLGMTMIYLVTGNHPTELSQTNGQVEFTAEISNRFRRWLEKMTQPHLDKRFDSAKNAQKSLEEEDGSYGDLLHLKPTACKVNLYRDRDKLKIVFPIKGMDSSLGSTILFLGFFGIITFGVIFAWYGAMPSTLVFSLVRLILLLTAGFFGICCLAYITLAISDIKNMVIDRHDEIVVDDQNISQYIYNSPRNTFLGYPKKKPPEMLVNSRSSIELIVYNPGYVFNEYFDRLDTHELPTREEAKISPDLYVSCGTAKYIIGEGLSKEELWWLGKEISDFLNLELQVIYPTQKIVCSGDH
jgi:Protein kinase domain